MIQDSTGIIETDDVPWDDYDALRETKIEIPDDETLRVVAFVDKGGTTKTTSLAHMAVIAHNELGLDTVLVSLDGKQNDLAAHFGLDRTTPSGEPIPEEDLEETESLLDDALKYPTIAQTFAPNLDEIDEFVQDQGGNDGGILDALTVPTGEGPDLIPASEELDGVDSSLSNIDDTSERYSKVDSFLTNYVDEHYDLVMIDVPGSTSNVAANALWASGHVFTPVCPSPLDTKQAEKIQSEIDEKREKHDELSDLELTMVMLSRIDKQTNAWGYFHDLFKQTFSAELAPEPIAGSQAVINAQLERQTLFAHAEDSSTANRAREQYRVNTAELIRRLSTPDWKDDVGAKPEKTEVRP